MEDLYFANKVIRSRQFLRYAKYHSDQLGCHVSNLYFLDNCIYVFRMIDGKYVSFNGEEYEEFNNVMANEELVCCDECEVKDEKPFSRDCENSPSLLPKCIGIANVNELTDIFRNYDPEEALKIIIKYNSELDNPLTFIGTDNLEYTKASKKANVKIRKYLRKEED